MGLLRALFIRKWVRLLFSLAFCWLTCSSLYAAEEGKRVTVVFSHINAPHVFSDHSGIAVDIVRKSLAFEGYRLEPLLVPIKRGELLFRENQCDAVAIVQKSFYLPQALYSDFFVYYHNVGVVLDSPHTEWIKGLGDIRFLNIIAYEKAHLYLGETFNTLVANNRNYHETEDQFRQVQMLLKGRTDIAIMDKSIFYYYQKILIQRNMASGDERVRFVDMFPPSGYRVAFKDETLLQAFNRGLGRLKETGGYQEIYKKYSVPFEGVKLP